MKLRMKGPIIHYAHTKDKINVWMYTVANSGKNCIGTSN